MRMSIFNLLLFFADAALAGISANPEETFAFEQLKSIIPVWLSYAVSSVKVWDGSIILSLVSPRDEVTARAISNIIPSRGLLGRDKINDAISMNRNVQSHTNESWYLYVLDKAFSALTGSEKDSLRFTKNISMVDKLNIFHLENKDLFALRNSLVSQLLNLSVIKGEVYPSSIKKDYENAIAWYRNNHPSSFSGALAMGDDDIDDLQIIIPRCFKKIQEHLKARYEKVEVKLHDIESLFSYRDEEKMQGNSRPTREIVISEPYGFLDLSGNVGR